MYLKSPCHQKLADFQYLTLAIGVSRDSAVCSTHAQLVTTDNQIHSVVIPVLNDGRVHRYCYDLDLLELAPDTVLSNIIYMPAHDIAAVGQKVSIGPILLSRRKTYELKR